MEWCEELYGEAGRDAAWRRSGRALAAALSLCILTGAAYGYPLREVPAGEMILKAGKTVHSAAAADKIRIPQLSVSGISSTETQAGDISAEEIRAGAAVPAVSAVKEGAAESVTEIPLHSFSGMQENAAGDLPLEIPEEPAKDIPPYLPGIEENDGAGDIPGGEVQDGAPDIPGEEAGDEAPDIPGEEAGDEAPDIPGEEAGDGTPDIPDEAGEGETSDVPGDDTESIPGEEEDGGASDVTDDAVGTVGGFLVDGSGMICGIADGAAVAVDGYMELPGEGCSGIARAAFTDISEEIIEVYIPANISYAEEGAFLGLDGVLWFGTEAESGDLFASEGVLYSDGGACLMAFPAGRVGYFLLPETVTRFADDAFAGTNLSMIDARKGNVTEIGNLPEDMIMR